MKRDPIKVSLDAKGEALLPTSRLSLSKVYTVEHNIPTYPVGKISSKDLDRVKLYCAEVQGLFVTGGKGSQALPDLDDLEEEDEDEE